MNETELLALGGQLTAYFTAQAELNRSKKIEEIHRSVLHHDRLLKQFHQNHQHCDSFQALARNYWNGLTPQLDVCSGVCSYSQVSGDFSEKYIHDGIFYTLCDSVLNNNAFAMQFDNKAYYPLLFHDVRQPGVLAMRINNNWVDGDYRVLSFDTVIQDALRKANL